MKLYCYSTSPIDFWLGAITGEQLFKAMWDSCWQDWDSLATACKQVGELKAQAEEAFKGTSKNTISPCVEAPIAYNLDS